MVCSVAVAICASAAGFAAAATSPRSRAFSIRSVDTAVRAFLNDSIRGTDSFLAAVACAGAVEIE